MSIAAKIKRFLHLPPPLRGLDPTESPSIQKITFHHRFVGASIAGTAMSLFFVSGTAGATIITGQFDTIVQGAYGGPPEGITSSTPVTVNFSYDTASAPVNTSTDPVRGDYYFTNNSASFSITANGLTWSSGQNVLIQVEQQRSFNINLTCSSDPSCFASFPGSIGYSSIGLSIVESGFSTSPLLLSAPNTLPTSASQFNLAQAGSVVADIYGVSNSSGYGWSILANSDASALLVKDGTDTLREPKLFGIAIGQNDLSGVRGDLGAVSIFDILSDKPNWASISEGNANSAIVFEGVPNQQESQSIVDLIASQIHSIQDNVLPGDTFIFYANTHAGPYGSAESERPDLLGNTQDEAFSFLMTDEQLTQLFSDAKWKDVTKIFVLDTCHSGGFIGGDGDLDTLTMTAVIAAAEEEQLAPTDPVSGRGLFTETIIAPALRDPNLTLSDLKTRVFEGMYSPSDYIAGLFGADLLILDIAAPGTSAQFSGFIPDVYISNDLNQARRLFSNSVPEPSTLFLLIPALSAIFVRRLVNRQ